MTQDNTNQKHQQEQSEISSKDEKKESSQDQSIPLAKFLEIKDMVKDLKGKLFSYEEKEKQLQESKLLEEKKDMVKDLKGKLSSYEEKEKQLQESKLLEEKNYQELLAKRDEELKSFKSQLEEERRNYKVASVKDKFARILDKNNAINSEDVLKLVDIPSLTEVEDQESAINKIVDNFKAEKAYLFKPAFVDHNENKKINNNTNKQANPNAKSDSALSIWMS